ncbi:hypothetical protein EhV145_00528 [Emiliania huxleyi virus 145]|nr:hypothetical protein EhV145_00528 [Emiliania huxleyi virus 145]AHA56081.1 hypothetical protein EhV164_00494 [Emiliania huxleyi virus 164]
MVKRIRQDGQPKRPVSGFIRFMNENRDRFNTQCKDQNIQGSLVTHVARLAKVEWREMNDETRQFWNAPAAEKIAIYNEEVAKWNAANPTPIPVQEPKKAKKVKKERPPGKVKKTTTSYILYYVNERNNTIAELNSEGAEITFANIVRRTSSKWKAHTPEQRAPWDAKAAELVVLAKAEAAKELEEHNAKMAMETTDTPVDDTQQVADAPTVDAPPPKPKRKYTRKPKVTEPVAEPVTGSVTEPVTEPVAEPVAEPVTEPVTEPVAEPVTEPVAEPVTEPVTEPDTPKPKKKRISNKQ